MVNDQLLMVNVRRLSFPMVNDQWLTYRVPQVFYNNMVCPGGAIAL